MRSRFANPFSGLRARTAVAVHEDLKQGLNSLATLTCLAPFIGMLATIVWGIPDSLSGLGTEKTHAMAMTFARLSSALAPTVLGILVGLQSLWLYKYFRGRLAQFDSEMENRSLQLLNELTPHLCDFGFVRPRGPLPDSIPFLETYSTGASVWGKSWPIVLLIAGWCLQVLRYFYRDSLPMWESMTSAGRYVVLMFGLSYLVAYALWIDLLHCNKSRLALVAALLCLCGCVGLLLFPTMIR